MRDGRRDVTGTGNIKLINNTGNVNLQQTLFCVHRLVSGWFYCISVSPLWEW